MASTVIVADPLGGVGVGDPPCEVGVAFALTAGVGVVEVLLGKARVGLPPALPQLAV
ncbi:MAG TPA: hypothetical protein VF043_25245 [Ktedonobacteraceae bacterium]